MPEQLDSKIFHKGKEAAEWRDEVRELGWPQSYVVSYVKVEDLDDYKAGYSAIGHLVMLDLESLNSDEKKKVLYGLVDAFQEGRDSVTEWPKPVHSSKIYWEVLCWREPFDPGDCLEFDHGDLTRNYFNDKNDALANARTVAKRRGVHTRVHEIVRDDIPIPFDKE